jgi:hypothetical protein
MQLQVSSTAPLWRVIVSVLTRSIVCRLRNHKNCDVITQLLGHLLQRQALAPQTCAGTMHGARTDPWRATA